MKVSITLPSIYPAALIRTLTNIRDATRCEYEVLVASPMQPPPIGAVIWVPEAKPMGANAGHAAAIKKATGDVVMAWVDDHILVDGWDVHIVRELETLKWNGPLLLGMRHVRPSHVGSIFGHYYPYFPIARKADIDKIGWYDPVFYRGFADCDLALRVWAAGGRCLWSREAALVPHLDDARKGGVGYDDLSLEIFLRRWRTKFGQGWDTGTLRGFNIDFTPESSVKTRRLTTDRSLNCTSAALKDAVGDGC